MYILQQGLKNKLASTYYITFTSRSNNDKFTIYDSNGKVYYYRYLPQGIRTIKVNIPDKGVYYLDRQAEIVRKPLQIVRGVYKIKLPPRERNRDKNYNITHDPNLTVSPAIIYTETGEIFTGASFPGLPTPLKIFILLHEIGHFRYKTEKYCDLYAFVEFVKMGYNPSTAMYCLTDVLRNNQANDERISYVYNKMIDTEIIR